MMFAVAKSAAVVLCMALLGTPAMACLVPGMNMTAAEHECCRHMARQCSGMRMPASHSCCRTELPAAKAYVASATVSMPTLSVVQSVVPIPLLQIGADQMSFASIHIEHPPPEFAIDTTVLRI